MAGNPNEEHQIPNLVGGPLNVSKAQVQEMQTAAYLLRMVCIGHEGPAIQRLKQLALSLEIESEAGLRMYKYARQRATDPQYLKQVTRGIVAVTNGEMVALGLKT